MNRLHACAPDEAEKTMAWEVGPAWSGCPVRFALLTTDRRQFVAYYDAEGHLVAASRHLGESDWKKIRLPETMGWDSHNLLTLGRDEEGLLHLSGNMHADPLVYFRTRRPDDVSSFERVTVMVGDLEKQITYPQFFRGPGGRLCFSYRHGWSGHGDHIFNAYDAGRRRWDRLSTGPFISGEGRCNAYIDGPVEGPDGFFHVCWVWRDDPESRSNHDVCYACSRDLVHWQDSAGRPLELPITQARAEVVDPVPAGGGLMNGNVRLGFDGAGRPVISYHKLDAAGRTQIYNARREEDGWRPHPATRWTTTWRPEGRNSISYPIRVYPVSPDAQGRLVQAYYEESCGYGKWWLDPVTLMPVEHRIAGPFPAGEWAVSHTPEMKARWQIDAAREAQGPAFALRWESLPVNGDRAVADYRRGGSTLHVLGLPRETLAYFNL